MLIRIACFLAVGVAIHLAIATALIISQPPGGDHDGETLAFPKGNNQAGVKLPELETFLSRDGATLGYRDVPGHNADAPVMVLIHGSGWHSEAYVSLARDLAAQTGMRVILPDLRGHGPLANPRGDVAYIGQLEDDLADLLDHLDVAQAVFLGHSSGGGLVVRMAGGPHRQRMKQAVLIAPFLKYNAPSTRQNSGGWARPLTRRIVGLSMLNMLGIRALNHLTVIEFDIPEQVRQQPGGAYATDAYSYRLNTSFAPRSKYKSDIAALPRFLLIAGQQDEAFVASAYEPLMSSVTVNGTYQILPGLGHLDILTAPETANAVTRFLAP